MLKKQNRLISSFEFNLVRKKGTYVGTPLFHIYFLKNLNPKADTKLGIVVPNKISKKAVVRNHLKRLFREASKNVITSMPYGMFFVIHPKANCLEKNYEEINTELDKAIQKISITK